MTIKPKNHSLLSEIPAIWNDNLVKKYPFTNTTPWPSRFGSRLLERLIDFTVLPVFLLIDSIHYGLKSITHRAIAKISADPQSILKQEKLAYKCQNVATKCLKALVLLPGSWICPDLVSSHFVPKVRDNKVRPTGGLYSQHAHRVFPQTKEDVQKIIMDAIKENHKVSILGAGFSQGRQTLPSSENDVIIDMKKMQNVTIDTTKKTATVGGGAKWAEIQLAANKEALAVQVMQASNVFSVGGSLSANCHGWDIRQGCLANTVNKITIVNSAGELQVLTPQDELFGYVVGGWGMFGVIVEVELQLTDNIELLEISDSVEIDEYINYFKNNIISNNNVHMHLYRLGLSPGKLLQEGFAQNYVKGYIIKPQVGLHFEKEEGSPTDRIFFNMGRHLKLIRQSYWKNEKKAVNRIKKMTRNEVMHPKISAAFGVYSNSRTEWLQEYFLPEEHLSEFIKFLGNVLDKNEVGLLNASVRYVPKDERAKMGYATEGNRFAVVLYFTQYLNEKEVEKTQNWIRQVIDKVHEFKGTFYLPYGHFAREEQFRISYPQSDEVLEAKNKFDPHTIFSNGLYEQYLKKA